MTGLQLGLIVLGVIGLAAVILLKADGKKDYHKVPRREPQRPPEPKPQAQAPWPRSPVATSAPKTTKGKQTYTLEEMLEKLKTDHRHDYKTTTVTYSTQPEGDEAAKKVEKSLNEVFKKADANMDKAMKRLDDAMKTLDDVFRKL